MLKDTFLDIYNRAHITSKELSRGGQGIVYRTEEPNILLKVEFAPDKLNLNTDIKNNDKFEKIRTLPMLDKINITLPQTVLKDIVGYTMVLLDDMKSFDDVFSTTKETNFSNKWLNDFGEENEKLRKWFAGYIASGGIRKRIHAYLNAAQILAKIHGSGLVYCDLSNKNMFVSSDYDNETVWLIDCDNLNYMKNTARKSGWMTPGYGAPEIYSGKGNTMYSDAYSFAVSLFWTLADNHPFVGEAVIEDCDSEEGSEADIACSRDYPWVCDKDDDSNKLDDSQVPKNLFISDNTMKYFHRTFGSKGKNNRQTRTTMPEWCYTLAKDLDHVVRCENCQMDYYGNEHNACPWCDHKSKIVKIISESINGDRRTNVWNIIHEITEDAFEVPLRILEGFFSDHIDNKAFKLKYDENELEIFDLCEGYRFCIVQDGVERPLYGHSRMSLEKNITILATDKLRKSSYSIRIEVV